MATPKKGMKTTTAPTPKSMMGAAVRPGAAKARAVATPMTQRVKSRMLQNEMTKLGILAGKKK